MMQNWLIQKTQKEILCLQVVTGPLHRVIFTLILRVLRILAQHAEPEKNFQDQNIMICCYNHHYATRKKILRWFLHSSKISRHVKSSFQFTRPIFLFETMLQQILKNITILKFSLTMSQHQAQKQCSEFLNFRLNTNKVNKT